MKKEQNASMPLFRMVAFLVLAYVRRYSNILSCRTALGNEYGVDPAATASTSCGMFSLSKGSDCDHTYADVVRSPIPYHRSSTPKPAQNS